MTDAENIQIVATVTGDVWLANATSDAEAEEMVRGEYAPEYRPNELSVTNDLASVLDLLDQHNAVRVPE